jgi:hypothetical protein
MKRLALCLEVLSLLVFGLSGVASAQGSTTTRAPGTWVSSINIQNTGSGAATVQLNFYDSTGAVALSFTASPAIPAGGSVSYYVPSTMSSLASGQYNVVASSDQPLQVVVNIESQGPHGLSSYMGLQSTDASMTLYFPGLYKNYYGFYSELVLQNTSATAANTTIKFFRQDNGAQNGTDIAATIPGNSTQVFALQDLTAVPAQGTVALSAQVTSTQALAGVANVWLPDGSGKVGTYDGVKAGGTVVYAPALYKSYWGFNSSMTVQNIGGSNNIQVTYGNGVTATTTLAANQAIEYYQPNNPALPSGNTAGVFSAKVESLNSQPLVVVVNAQGATTLTSYNGSALATVNGVNCPVVLKGYYNFFSAETVENVGTLPTDVTITYSGGQFKTFPGVPANGTVNIIELPATGSVLPDNSSVSAVITSSNSQPLVAVVQENMYAGAVQDTLASYTCVAR